METCLLHAKNIPHSLWDEVVNCSSYIHNRVSHKSVVEAIPFKEQHGHKANVSHLRVFCSKSWAIIPIDKRKAFQVQSSECTLLGYAKYAKAYKLMEVAT